jgi:hypothetical protein
MAGATLILFRPCDAVCFCQSKTDGIFYNLQGQGAKIEGLGTYLPKVGLDGTFDVSHRLDKAIENGLNVPGAFSGEIENRENAFCYPVSLTGAQDSKTADDPVA